MLGRNSTPMPIFSTHTHPQLLTPSSASVHRSLILLCGRLRHQTADEIAATIMSKQNRPGPDPDLSLHPTGSCSRTVMSLSARPGSRPRSLTAPATMHNSLETIPVPISRYFVFTQHRS